MKRECGGCTLCCKLVPVQELAKPAGVRCDHQRATGCNIYARRPVACRAWFCSWLINNDTADLSRPDRSHYVIDMMPDYVTATDNASGEKFSIPVVQIWLDPKHPNAHRDPALRRFLERRAEKGVAGLIRLNSHEGFVLFAPPMTEDGTWHEQGHSMRETQHSFEDITAVLRANAGE